jgi:CRISPR-associated protein Csb2
MSQLALLIDVRLLTGRYHGVGDWPPSPFRLFQALVNGAYGGRWVTEPEADKDVALQWLEQLDPPLMLAPASVRGRVVRSYVPNNDLDAFGGDPTHLADVRVAKETRARIVAGDAPFSYAWKFDSVDASRAEGICRLADRLHTLGRGVDSAYASGRILGWEEALEQFRAAGPLAVPSPGAAPPRNVRCPMPGSLASLKARYAQWRHQLERQPSAAAATLFRQPPKARCRMLAYDRPAYRLLFDIRPSDDATSFRALPQARAHAVATAVRDLAFERLSRAFNDRAHEIERVLVARGAPVPASRRVRFIPLPSVGSPQVSPAIRRVLVEVPADCPLAPGDVNWALAGQFLSEFRVVNPETGEVLDALLVPSADTKMLRHYGIDTPSRRWRSLTAVALPQPASAASRSGRARVDVERVLTGRVLDALRHAGLPSSGVLVRIQREPFSKRGVPAPSFSDGRFGPSRLYHVDVEFPHAVSGPIAIGDGRWVGLGLMAPVRENPPVVHVFRISGGRWPLREAAAILRALRRAVMSRVAETTRSSRLAPYFTGHEPSGAPQRAASHTHLFYLAYGADRDGTIDHVAVVAPHLVDRTGDAAEFADERRILAQALEGVSTVHAGALGVAGLTREGILPNAIFGRSRAWKSFTSYRPTRHPKVGKPEEAIAADVRTECARRGLPAPAVEVLNIALGPKGGLRCHVMLHFAALLSGPVLLGAGSHFGEGLFVAVDAAERL